MLDELCVGVVGALDGKAVRDEGFDLETSFSQEVGEELNVTAGSPVGRGFDQFKEYWVQDLS